MEEKKTNTVPVGIHFMGRSLGELLELKAKCRRRLQFLDENQERISAYVCGKLRQEYRSYLDAVDSEVSVRLCDYEVKLAETRVFSNQLELMQKSFSDSIQEVMLRYTLGEYDKARYEQLTSEYQGRMQQFEEGLLKFSGEQKRIREFLEKVCGNGAFAAEKAVAEPIEPQAETDAPPPPAAESLPEVEAIPEPAAPEQVAEIITDEEAAPSAEDLESLTAELAAKVSIDENVEDGEISESLEEGETGEKSTDDEELEQVARSLMEDIEVYEQEESKPQSASLKHKVQAGEVISGEEQFGEGEALEQEEPVSQQENEEELPGLAEVNSEHSPTGIEEKEDLGRDSDNGQAGGEEPAPEIGLSESVPEESVAPDLDSAVAEMMGEPGARSEPGAAEEEPAELDSAVAEMMGEPGARSEPGTAEEEPADMDSAIAEMMGGPEASSSSAAAPASVPVDLDAIMSAAAGTDLDTSPGPGEPAPVAEESEEGRGDEEVEEGKKEPEEEPGGNHFSDSLIEEGQVELSQPVVEDTAVTEPGGNGQGEERDNGKEAESFSGEEEGEVERTEEAEKEVPEEGIIDLGGEQEKEDSPGDNTDAPALSLDEKLAITMGDDGQGDTEGVLSVNQTIDAIKKKTVKCPVCGNMNYAIRWYCENCEATLTSL